MSKSSKKTEANPHLYEELARGFCETLTDEKEDIFRAAHWNETAYFFDGTKYAKHTDREVNRRIRQYLMTENKPVNNFVVSNTAPIVQDLLTQDRWKHPTMPFYIGTDTTFPKPENIVSYRNGLLDLTAYLVDKPALRPHTPLWISPNCLPYDYDPSAACPQWLKFLAEAFEGDMEQPALLQEYAGYLLTNDISLQKLLLLCGVARGGKGTISAVLTGLVGKEQTAGFSLTAFAAQFGLEVLLGKLFAVCGEVELQHCRDKGQILATLKNITGGDEQTIHRKFLPDITTILSTRLVVSCNSAPVFFESTGTLATRLLILKFNRSWYGHEDTTLGDRLATELPGIANWALEGLKRLRANGRFSEPAASKEAVREFMRDSSYERAFIADRLVVESRFDPATIDGLETTDEPLTATKKGVENAYRGWCLNERIQVEDDKWKWFWRRLLENLPKVKGDTNTWGDNKIYKGIALKKTTGNGTE
jgi:P4 family phage/plasmid primase-like protien